MRVASKLSARRLPPGQKATGVTGTRQGPILRKTVSSQQGSCTRECIPNAGAEPAGERTVPGMANWFRRPR